MITISTHLLDQIAEATSAALGGRTITDLYFVLAFEKVSEGSLDHGVTGMYAVPHMSHHSVLGLVSLARDMDYREDSEAIEHELVAIAEVVGEGRICDWLALGVSEEFGHRPEMFAFRRPLSSDHITHGLISLIEQQILGELYEVELGDDEDDN